MKILYLSYFSSPEVFQKISDAGLCPSEARQNYEAALIKNLLADPERARDLTVVSYLPYCKALGKVPSEDEYLGKRLHYVWTRRNSPFDILKAMRRVKKLVKNWLKETAGEQRIILTYAANPILLQPIVSMIKQTKVVTVCSEIPKYRNMTEGNKLLNAIKKKVFTYYNEKMSGYIYMSAHMNEVCNKKGAPWIVVEGMTDILPLGEREPKMQECVFYAGGLHVENGIDVLLDAIVMLNEAREEKVLLQLCGIGNAEQRIKEYAARYDFVRYLGVLPNQEIRALEKRATLLINPRRPDQLLTKYSFPSKTFEYFSSGTASVLTELQGIPSEFYEYCYTCRVDSAEILAQDLKAVLSIPPAQREELATRAHDFLCREKSAQMQTKRILVFLEQLSKS